jgi:SAM-dependent methyltransferase
VSAIAAARRRLRASVDLEWQSLAAAMERAAPYARGRLLDVGCGEKPWQALLAPRVSEHLGVEYADTLHGSLNARDARADVVYAGDRMPFEDASFDTVLSNQVLEHVPDPRALWADMVRVLRPGGNLIVTVPFSFRIHAAPHDYWRFTSYALRELCREHALEVEMLEPRGGLWRVVGQKIATFLAFDCGRLRGEAQRAGGMRYEAPDPTPPRWWALPFVAPAIVAVTSLARALDGLDRRRVDTLGYLLVARRPT